MTSSQSRSYASRRSRWTAAIVPAGACWSPYPTSEGNRLVHEHGVGARLAARGLRGIHVDDGALAADLRGQHGHADEGRVLVLGGHGEDGLPPTLEPRVPRAHGPRRPFAHRHVETPAQEASDASAPVTVPRRDGAALEVHAVAAQEPRRARIEGNGMLQEHAAARGRRRLAYELEAQESGALRPRDRPRLGRHLRATRGERRRGGGGIDAHLSAREIEHARGRAEGGLVARAGSERVFDEPERIRHGRASNRVSKPRVIIRELTAPSPGP